MATSYTSLIAAFPGAGRREQRRKHDFYCQVVALQGRDAVQAHYEVACSGTSRRTRHKKVVTNDSSIARHIRDAEYSGWKRVYLDKVFGLQISANGKTTSLGDYDTEEQAAIAFDRASISKVGRNAKTNFPLDNYADEINQLEGILQSTVMHALDDCLHGHTCSSKQASKQAGRQAGDLLHTQPQNQSLGTCTIKTALIIIVTHFSFIIAGMDLNDLVAMLRSKAKKHGAQTSHFRGVSLLKQTKKWHAQINVGGKQVKRSLQISTSITVREHDPRANIH